MILKKKKSEFKDLKNNREIRFEKEFQEKLEDSLKDKTNK